MNNEWVKEETRNTRHQLWLKKIMVKHWFKMRWIEFKNLFTARVTHITNMESWEMFDDVLICYVEWQRRPKYFPIPFPPTLRGYMVEDWGQPIEAEFPDQAIECYAEHVEKLDNAVKSAERLLEQLERASAQLGRTHLQG